jgi:hypothetical protein
VDMLLHGMGGKRLLWRHSMRAKHSDAAVASGLYEISAKIHNPKRAVCYCQ